MSAGENRAPHFEGSPRSVLLLGARWRGGVDVELRAIESPEAAEVERFLGSPTVRVKAAIADPGADGRTGLRPEVPALPRRGQRRPRPAGRVDRAGAQRGVAPSCSSSSTEEPVPRRTVNKYRATLHAIRLRPRAGAAEPLAARRQPGGRHAQATPASPGHLEVFTVEQVEALAWAAETGAWRHEREYAAVNTVHLRRAEDRELADLRVAAYTGAAPGRARGTSLGGRPVVRARHRREERRRRRRRRRRQPPHPLRPGSAIRRARRARLAVAAAELHRSAGLRLRHRGGRPPRPVGAASLRRVLGDAAGLPSRCDSTICATRPAACSVRVLDPVTVKDIMGHADLATTERVPPRGARDAARRSGHRVRAIRFKRTGGCRCVTQPLRLLAT